MADRCRISGRDQAYCRPMTNPFGIGVGPRGADPGNGLMAWPLPPAASEGVSSSRLSASGWISPIRFPMANAKSASWPSGAGRLAWKIVKMRTPAERIGGGQPEQGQLLSEPLIERRHDALQWTPTGPLYSAQTPARPFTVSPGRCSRPWPRSSLDDGAERKFPDRALFHDPALPGILPNEI